MHIDVTGFGGKYTAYFNGEMACSRSWRWSLLMARLKYYNKRYKEVFYMLDKNGVKITRGKVVMYQGEEHKVQFASGRKLILTDPKKEMLHLKTESIKNRITNIEVIN